MTFKITPPFLDRCLKGQVGTDNFTLCSFLEKNVISKMKCMQNAYVLYSVRVGHADAATGNSNKPLGGMLKIH